MVDTYQPHYPMKQTVPLPKEKLENVLVSEIVQNVPRADESSIFNESKDLSSKIHAPRGGT